MVSDCKKLNLTVQPWAWADMASMPEVRVGPALQFIESKGAIYLIGGGDSRWQPIKKTAKYDIIADTWNYISNLFLSKIIFYKKAQFNSRKFIV